MARSAASAQAAGSIMDRRSVRSRKNFGSKSCPILQNRISGSSSCHMELGNTCVPRLGRVSTNPLAASTRMASLITPRPTSSFSTNSSSKGRISPAAYLPLTMSRPMRATTAAWFSRVGIGGVSILTQTPFLSIHLKAPLP